MLDEHGEVIYRQGESAQNASRAIFAASTRLGWRPMVAHVADFNVVIVQSEFEALVLELAHQAAQSQIWACCSRTIGLPFVRRDDDYSRTDVSHSSTARRKDGAKYFGLLAAGA